MVDMGKFCFCLILCECAYERYGATRRDYRFLPFLKFFLPSVLSFPIPGVNECVNVYYDYPY